MSEKSLSFYELECLLGEFIESKGFTLHSSIFTASKVSKAEGYRYSLVVSKSQEDPSVEEGRVSGDAIKQLHAVIRKYWCDEFEHGESCKHCTLEFKICIPLLKVMYPEFAKEAEAKELVTFWEGKPELGKTFVEGDRGSWEVDKEFYPKEAMDDWLEILRSRLMQMQECLGEFESKEWCSHCIINNKCAQITLKVELLNNRMIRE